MSRTLLVFGQKIFKLTIPNDARVTFGPWSPPNAKGYTREHSLDGTLRVYDGPSEKASIIFVQSGVSGYRDLDKIEYTEQIAKEEGATIWKSDQHGYQREEKHSRKYEWVNPETPKLDEARE